MKRLLRGALALLFSLFMFPAGATTTANIPITLQAGPGFTGQAANVRAVIYAQDGSTYVASTNAPLGVSFAESANVPGSFYAVVPFDVTRLPARVDVTITGTSVAVEYAIGIDRGSAAAAGYGVVTLPSVVPSLAQMQAGLPTDSSIQTDLGTALNTAIPGSPVSNSYAWLLSQVNTHLPQSILFDANGYVKADVQAYGTGMDPQTQVLREVVDNTSGAHLTIQQMLYIGSCILANHYSVAPNVAAQTRTITITAADGVTPVVVQVTHYSDAGLTQVVSRDPATFSNLPQ